MKISPLPPGRKPPRILVVAGEASGDQHAAMLVAALHEQRPELEFFGIGGGALSGQGMRILVPAEELAVVGLSEVVRHLPAVVQALRRLARAFREERPQLAILVDFPDFNFWVARLAKYFRIPVMYYISPQVWAWRTYRVRTIARLVDRMVVIFPFEEEFYRQHGVPVTYVGHPLGETLPPAPERRAWLRAHGLAPQKLTIALLPGSRNREIERHLPTMLAGAKLIYGRLPQSQFLLPLAATAPVELVEELVRNLGKGARGGDLTSPGPPLKIIAGQSYQALTVAHLAVVASGTATVEAALAGTPSIVVYRVSPVTYAVGRRLIRVSHVAMANLLAEERLFPELIQDEFTPARLAWEAVSLIRDPERLAAVRRGLARVADRLGGPGASARAARVALALLEEGKIQEK